MAKVSGIDFSSLNKFRETATVRMPDGSEVELPLIKVRDANMAILFLQRNDNIAAKYGVVSGRIKHKADTLKDLQDAIEGKDEVLKLAESEGMESIEDAINVIGEAQKKLTELQKECHELCDEIHEFIAPYLVGTDVVKQLKENDDIYTIKVLQFMLYGVIEPAKETTAEENPTTEPVENN